MRAVIRESYGDPDVLRVEEVPMPTPGEGEILIRVAATTVKPYDHHFMTGKPAFMRLATSGVFRPKQRILGGDLAGRVEALGPNVTEFQVGDEVFGQGSGAYAQYAIARADRLAKKPAGVSHAEAAASVLSGLTALLALRDSGLVQPGQRVLVIGASGRVGSFAVQMAKAMGAHVTAVCGPTNVALVKSLGADAVVDYTSQDWATSGDKYDVIIDLVFDRPYSHYTDALVENGRWVITGMNDKSGFLGPIPKVLAARRHGKRARRTVVLASWEPNTQADIEQIAAWLERGVLAPVIEARFVFPAVADAMRRYERGHARGHLVVVSPEHARGAV